MFSLLMLYSGLQVSLIWTLKVVVSKKKIKYKLLGKAIAKLP